MTKVAIPTSPAELEEMLNDPGKVENLMKEGQFPELVTAYARNVMNKDKSIAAQVKEETQLALANLLGEDTANSDIKRINLSLLNGRANAGNGALHNAAYNPQAFAASLDGTYANLGDLALDVYKANKTGAEVRNKEAWDKVVKLSNAYSENDPGSGGFLIPEEMRSQIMSLALENSVVRSRATVITMQNLTTRIPFIDETTHSGSLFGGMIFYWVGESATITSTSATFGSVRLEANKLVGGARIPNELWNDAPALRTWLQANAPRGLAHFEDQAFISGNGVGQPFGFLNSPALVQYDRATTDVYALSDVVGMYARMLPSSLGNAVWICNQTALPQLFAMNTGTGGYPLGVVNIRDTPVFTLLGRPLIVTEKVPALANGAGNELAFVDLSYYLVGDRQAVSLDFSEHSRFMNDETELRLINRVDGRPWIQSALTPVHGDTLSPFVGITDA